MATNCELNGNLQIKQFIYPAVCFVTLNVQHVRSFILYSCYVKYEITATCEISLKRRKYAGIVSERQSAGHSVKNTHLNIEMRSKSGAARFPEAFFSFFLPLLLP